MRDWRKAGTLLVNIEQRPGHATLVITTKGRVHFFIEEKDYWSSPSEAMGICPEWHRFYMIIFPDGEVRNAKV